MILRRALPVLVKQPQIYAGLVRAQLASLIVVSHGFCKFFIKLVKIPQPRARHRVFLAAFIAGKFEIFERDREPFANLVVSFLALVAKIG